MRFLGGKRRKKVIGMTADPPSGDDNKKDKGKTCLPISFADDNQEKQRQTVPSEDSKRGKRSGLDPAVEGLSVFEFHLSIWILL
jgi:hypothetical protein